MYNYYPGFLSAQYPETNRVSMSPRREVPGHQAQ